MSSGRSPTDQFSNEDALARVAAGNVAMLGLCWDDMSTYLHGCADAPPAIRAALHCGAANLTAENGMDIGDAGLVDVGDLALPDGLGAVATIDAIERGVARLLDLEAKVLSLGGDHAVTFPILRAFAKKHGPPEILHFDAHPDLYDDYQGNRYSHACPFARIMEEGLARRLVQVGIRTMNRHQSEQAKRFAVEVLDMTKVEQAFDLHFEGPVYVSMDLDGLDPAFAPGVSHHEPGGLSTRDVLRIVHRIDAPIVGADIVEFNPERDVGNMTAMVCAKLVKEFAGAMSSS